MSGRPEVPRSSVSPHPEVERAAEQHEARGGDGHVGHQELPLAAGQFEERGVVIRDPRQGWALGDERRKDRPVLPPA